MSISQFSFQILPVDGLLNVHNSIPTSIAVVPASLIGKGEQLDQACDALPNYWLHSPTSKLIVEPLASLLEESDSWQENARTFGVKGETQIDIWFDNNDLERIKIAVSLRELDKNFLSSVIHIAQNSNCVFAEIATGIVFSPTPKDVAKHAIESPAGRYLPSSLNAVDALSLSIDE